jgi:hypothetical protein
VGIHPFFVMLLGNGVSWANHELGPPPYVSVDESESKATIVLRPGCPATTVQYIEYGTANGTAEAGKDYTAASGRITAEPYQFEVPLLKDALQEEDETVRLIIKGPGTEVKQGGGGSCVGVNQVIEGRLTILDNDRDASASVANSSEERGTSRALSQPSAKGEARPTSLAGEEERTETPSAADSTETRKAGPLTAESEPRASTQGQSRPVASALAVFAVAVILLAVFWWIRRRLTADGSS